MDSLVKEREWFNNKGGWRAQDNYYSAYASCEGDEVMTEKVITGLRTINFEPFEGFTPL